MLRGSGATPGNTQPIEPDSLVLSRTLSAVMLGPPAAVLRDKGGVCVMLCQELNWAVLNMQSMSSWSLCSLLAAISQLIKMVLVLLKNKICPNFHSKQGTNSYSSKFTKV